MEAGLFHPEDTVKKDKTGKPLSSTFDCLNVYTPSEAFLNAPDITPEPSVQYTVEQEPTLEDAKFAVLTPLDDLENIKDEISELWKQYAGGRLDLAAAAVAINTAFEIAQSLENEVKDLLDKFDGSAVLLESLFQSACETHGVNTTAGQKSDLFNVEAYQVAKTMHINTMSCLKNYIQDSKATDTSNTYKGKFGRYDEKLGANGKTNSEKWTQDRAAMMTLLPDLQFLGTKAGQGNAEDELIRGIRELFDDPNKRLSVWLLWALNVWLDILQGFEYKCGQAYGELKQESLKIQKALLNLPATPERKEVLHVVTRWNRDPAYIARMTMFENGKIKMEDLGLEYTFLRRHPTFCGLLLHHYRSHLHYRGVEVAAYSGGLMCTTQLYHALRNENRLSDKRWEDLETLWRFQGDPCFFVGGPPQDREGYYRNFGLCIGVSATNWAPNRRDTRPVVYKKNAPNMKRDGWVSLHVFKRHLIGKKREPWTAAYVAELLADGHIKAMQDGKGKWYAHIKSKDKEVGFTSFYDEIPTNAI